MHPLLKPNNLFDINGLAILSGFHDIPQYQACRGEKWPIGGHFSFYRLEIFFKMHPLLKPHNLFYSKGVAILSGFHDIPQNLSVGFTDVIN